MAAIVSPRIRTSIVQHPVIHAIWFTLALAAMLFIFFLFASSTAAGGHRVAEHL
jgi:hypothetical protein